MATSSSNGHWATEQDWSAKKDLIRHLYFELQKPLKEVAHVLKDQHDFHATTKMYKSRLKEWGFRKNMTASESMKIQRQMYTGKANLPVVGGRPLGSKRLRAQVQMQERALGMAKGKCARADGPRYIRPPDSIHLPEGALYETLRWSQVGLEQQWWDFSSLHATVNATTDWGVQLREAAMQISMKQNHALGFQLLNECCAEFRSVLQQQQYVLIWAIFVVFVEMDPANEQAALSLAKFLADMCYIELGSGHSLTKLCRTIQSMGVSLAKASATSILLSQLDMFRQCSGPGNAVIALKRLLILQWLHGHGLVSLQFCITESAAAFLELKKSSSLHEKDKKIPFAWAGLSIAEWLKGKQQYSVAEVVVHDIRQWHEVHGLELNVDDIATPPYITST
ncbi:Clr5 domain-containing protein [Truncatella angustata]|uniref:Clr5 domain-containing protein n=1 Tax=Truncatella angustata TaxID=152316 RepID=A0A9P8UGN3_9PEZI|nr:Clr5 domain-containing protein [Truncatella angustata]KAH6651982.1 Clr5 domain-containing protein [Truncatella angustata]